MRRIKLFENFMISEREKYPDIADFYDDQRSLPRSEFIPEDIKKINDFYTEIKNSEFDKSGFTMRKNEPSDANLWISGHEIHIVPKQDCYLLNICLNGHRQSWNQPKSEKYTGYKCSTLEDAFDTIREMCL